ncbi:MAG: thioredoxin domain-containing protein, partial [Bacteroidota bacterium]
KNRFDFENGGRNGYPKFPMPVNLEFLLYYGFVKEDVQVLDFIRLTLQKMAFGGIYDHIGGGFARYSVDEKWKVPHFEKMLYDNGQLIEMYSKGYQYYKLEDFKKVVYETAHFVERELMSEEGAFYSSLDADSEGVEGKYYVWTFNELKEVLNEDMELFARYFNVNPKGLWEDGNYILLKDMTDEDFAARNNLSSEELREKVKTWKKLLLQKRTARIPPALDDKTLCSWNALVIQGLTQAYKAFGDDYFRELALKNADFISQKMMDKEGKLFHSYKNGKVSVNGFMDDYALVMQAYISLFEITGDEKWLQLVRQLLKYTDDNFYDEASGLFYYTAKHPAPSISNYFQNEDNVIPAANSVMASNLHSLYLLYGNSGYFEKSKKMLQHITLHFQKYPHAFANWGKLMLKLTESYYEVAITGEKAEEKLKLMQADYKPNVLWAAASVQSSVPLLKDRFSAGETLIYVCRDNTCHLPVKNVQDALMQMKQGV